MSALLPRAHRVAPFALSLMAACAGSRRPASDPASAVRRDTVSAVTAEQIQQTPGVPIETLLMSRSPGVWVGRSESGALVVRIRGATTFYGNNQPLYILDGSPFQPGSDGGLTGVNPYDIESIRVLKDAAELSMYGSRGANGVIIIRTKRSGQ